MLKRKFERASEIFRKEGVRGLVRRIVRIYLRPIPTRLYILTQILPRVLYLRRSFIVQRRQTEADLNTIMRSLDRWVAKHGDGTYVAEDFIPVPDHGTDPAIQQVRREIAEFVRIILLKGLHNSILEIGLGNHGGTHILWRHIFKHVVTIDFDDAWDFRLDNWLDSGSTFIVGRSEDPATLEKAQDCLGSVDVLFIDADHNYGPVARDWAMYHKLVRPGGIVAFHDSAYALYGVGKFLEDLAKGAVDNKCHTLHHIVYSVGAGISYEEC